MDYLDQKQLLLESILENTQAQTRAIEDDELEVLETLITQRASLMEQVDKLDQLDYKVETGPSEESVEPVEPVEDLLKQIITIDDANQSRMKQELGNVKIELRKIRTGRQGEEHYGTEYGSYKEEGIFFDTKE